MYITNQKKNMRRTFRDELIKLMKEDKTIILILGGVGEFEEVKKLFPDRYFDVGVCEQTMISMAAGMALQGLKPYVYTITPFLIERPYEQIKLDIDQMNTNVKLLGYAEYPEDGITHQTPNIKYIMKSFNNIKSFYPNNKEEFLKALKNKGPTFIKLINI